MTRQATGGGVDGRGVHDEVADGGDAVGEPGGQVQGEPACVLDRGEPAAQRTAVLVERARRWPPSGHAAGGEAAVELDDRALGQALGAVEREAGHQQRVRGLGMAGARRRHARGERTRVPADATLDQRRHVGREAGEQRRLGEHPPRPQDVLDARGEHGRPVVGLGRERRRDDRDPRVEVAGAAAGREGERERAASPPGRRPSARGPTRARRRSPDAARSWSSGHREDRPRSTIPRRRARAP